MSKKTRRGRPPSGPAGERVSEYPALTIRLPRATKDTVEALAVLRREPIWKVIDTMVRAFVSKLPADKRETLNTFVATVTPQKRRADD